MCVCVCVIGVIQYGARTSNCSFSGSHLASSHTKYDTSFVFSMLFYQENEYVYVTECKAKKNNKRKHVYINSIINSICNKFTRSLLHIHIYICRYICSSLWRVHSSRIMEEKSDEFILLSIY
jgi:hypothetical protein